MWPTLENVDKVVKAFADRGVTVNYTKWFVQQDQYEPIWPKSIRKFELEYPSGYSTTEILKDTFRIFIKNQDRLIEDKTSVSMRDNGGITLTFHFSYTELSPSEMSPRKRVVILAPEPGESNW